MASTPSREFEQRLEMHLADPVVADVLYRLKTGLCRTLTYHTYEHTIDVIQEAINLSLTDKLDPQAEQLLVLAAAYHDAGFLHLRTANEGIAAEMLRADLSARGTYSDTEINLVATMVLDTQIFTEDDSPLHLAHSQLSGYLIDADMANLGRADFFDCLQALIIETSTPRREYLHNTLALVRRHRWFSPAANSQFAGQKTANAWELEKLVLREGS